MAANEPAPSLWSRCTTSTAEFSHERTSNDLVSDEDPPTDGEDDPLIGEEDDPLIPPSSDIDRTFHDGKTTWEALLSQANDMPSGLWPAGMLDPHITLVDVPALPDQLPRSDFLYGRPCWHIPLGIASRETVPAVKLDDGDAALAYGRRISFRLRTKDSIRCDACPQAASFLLGNSAKTTNSLAVLTMCWSYILSVRLLEMQGRAVQYTMHRLWPQSDKRCEQSMIDLEGASPSLIRWLCAVLDPDLGWRAKDKGFLPPWAATFKTDVRLVIRSSDSAAGMLSPPSSPEATELLIELCGLFRLGTDLGQDVRWDSIPPYKAAFFAALMLPFYDYMKLQPRLPPPHLTRAEGGSMFDTTHERTIRQYITDLQYFMTLSIHPPSLGSVLWSIFWQPGIDCNLVSPWLASILDVLGPTIDGKRIETLVKMFLSRRPRVALWWLALFLLGDLSVLGWIQRYAEKLEEKYGFGSLSPPDPMVSAWTGSKQSFLDLERDALYMEHSDLVSRADLLRCRFDFRLQYSASTLLSWRPFGYIKKTQVEPELWPQLEAKSIRQYHSFIWYPHRELSYPSYGFRRDTGRHVKNVPDDLERRSSSTKCQGGCQRDIKLTPSEESTCRMMFFLVEDATGGRDWANAASLAKAKGHRWLRDWEGLDTMEEEDKASPTADATKQPSWFLTEWMNRRHAFDENNGNTCLY